MKMKHNRPQKRLIIQLSLWLALLLTFTGCAESTVTPQDNTYAIEQPATIPSELLEASETAISEPESGQPQEYSSDTQEAQQVTSATDVPTGEGTSAFSLREIPAYSGTPYTEVNGNKPYFTEADLTTQSFEIYSDFILNGYGWLRLFTSRHLPIQNLLKIFPSISSVEICPVISPR